MNTAQFRIGSLSSSEPQKTAFMIEHGLLPNSWYEEMRDKTNIIWNIQKLDLAWRSCHENASALREYIDSHAKELSISSEMHLLTNEAQDALMKVTQLITNCIVSYTACLTMCEQHMERTYKEDEEKLIKWNEFRRQLHKDTFEYRLGYDLRNYTQHYGIPISEVVFSMNSTSLKKLEVFVKTAELLSGSFNWNRDRKDELSSVPSGTVDVNSMSVEYLSCVDKVYAGVLQSHDEQLAECDSYIMSLRSKFRIKPHEHPVVFMGCIPPGEKVPRKREFIPAYLLDRMKYTWEEKLRFNITKH